MELWRRFSPICRRSSETSKLELVIVANMVGDRGDGWYYILERVLRRLEGVTGSWSWIGALRVGCRNSEEGECLRWPHMDIDLAVQKCMEDARLIDSCTVS